MGLTAFAVAVIFGQDIQFFFTGIRDEYPHERRDHHTSVSYIDSYNNTVVTHDPDCLLCKKNNKAK